VRVTMVEGAFLRDFPVRHVVTTRWADNDMYGHVNNAVYYAYFDAAINSWIAPHLDVPFEQVGVMGVVAESGCRFLRPLSFPGAVTIAFRIERLGRSSVSYALGAFEGEDPTDDAIACAEGHWVHVYVDRVTGLSCPIPASLKAAMASIAKVSE